MAETTKTSFWARLLFYLALANLAVILVSIGGRLLLGWQPLAAFHTMFYGAFIGMGLAAIAILLLLTALFKRAWPLTHTASLTLLLGLCPIGGSLLIIGPSGFSSPKIHDISTDRDNPPAFSAAIALRKPEENSLDYGGEAIAAQQHAAFPDIKPLFSVLNPDQAFKQALSTASALGWTLIEGDSSAGRIEAFDQSRLFGFIDDVVIRITPLGEGSRIDVRSVSRVGVSDLGANARRIRLFFANFGE
ncbi:MAG: DUF1499 domain-containing protein [Gammaproteobacteria bacterium]